MITEDQERRVQITTNALLAAIVDIYERETLVTDDILNATLTVFACYLGELSVADRKKRLRQLKQRLPSLLRHADEVARDPRLHSEMKSAH